MGCVPCLGLQNCQKLWFLVRFSVFYFKIKSFFSQKMEIQKRCLLCGEENKSLNYTCSCSVKPWTKEYRMLDVRLALTKPGRKRIIRSALNYQFDHPDGMLQYAGLPFRRSAPPALEAVGMTGFHPLHYFGEEAPGTIYVKNEGGNPSGCFKDRETLMCLLHTRAHHWHKAVIYSSGNAAASAALLAQQLGLSLVTFVAGDTYDEKIEFIQKQGSDVIVIGDTDTNFEEGFRTFAELNARGLFEQQGYDNWSVRNPFRVQGDKTTALEIVLQLGERQLEVPDFAIVPSANGSGLVGLWKGFKELKRLGLIDRLPRMVAAGIRYANPVAKAVYRGEVNAPQKCDLQELEQEDHIIGSTIIAEEGYDSMQAAKAVLESDGGAIGITKEEVAKTIVYFLEKEKELALKESILPEPASLVTLTAARKIQKRKISKKGDRIVSIITGHGFKARTALYQLLKNRPHLRSLTQQLIDQKKRTMSAQSPQKGHRFYVSANLDTIRDVFNNLNLQLSE